MHKNIPFQDKKTQKLIFWKGSLTPSPAYTPNPTPLICKTSKRQHTYKCTAAVKILATPINNVHTRKKECITRKTKYCL